MSAALDILDAFLAETKHQSLMDAGAVRDALLDIRAAMTAEPPAALRFPGQRSWGVHAEGAPIRPE